MGWAGGIGGWGMEWERMGVCWRSWRGCFGCYDELLGGIMLVVRLIEVRGFGIGRGEDDGGGSACLQWCGCLAMREDLM